MVCSAQALPISPFTRRQDGAARRARAVQGKIGPLGGRVRVLSARRNGIHGGRAPRLASPLPSAQRTAGRRWLTWQQQSRGVGTGGVPTVTNILQLSWGFLMEFLADLY